MHIFRFSKTGTPENALTFPDTFMISKNLSELGVRFASLDNEKLLRHSVCQLKEFDYFVYFRRHVFPVKHITDDLTKAELLEAARHAKLVGLYFKATVLRPQSIDSV